MKNFFSWLKGLSIAKKVLLGFGALIVLGAAGGHNQPLNTTAPTSSSQQQLQTTSKPAVKADTITKQTVTETQSIPFDSKTVNDPTLNKGVTQITTVGVNGEKTLTYEVTYTNGVQTGKQLVKEEVTTQPITQITSVGTYVAPAPSCPNGTYVNTYGDTVCSPYSSPTAPAGATAQCVDGTYSFSQTHSGTCSHHGGVAQWL